MNRTIKDATTKRYHYDNHDQLKAHLDLFLDAYNHARRPKTLKGLTPAQFIWKEWQPSPTSPTKSRATRWRDYTARLDSPISLAGFSSPFGP